MTRKTLLSLAATFFLLVVMGLVSWRRFDLPAQELVTVIDQNQSSHQTGATLSRGAIIETGEQEYLAIRIGNDLLITLDQKTRLELHRLFTDERIIRFTRGRIVIHNSSTDPLLVETRKTEHLVSKATVAFINYDFKQLVTIAPLVGSVQSHIKGEKDYLLVPRPITISENDYPILSKTEFNTSTEPSADFHAWSTHVFESIMPPPTTTDPS